MRVTRTPRPRPAPCLALLGEVLLNPISDGKAAIVSVKGSQDGPPDRSRQPLGETDGVPFVGLPAVRVGGPDGLLSVVQRFAATPGGVHTDTGR
jgi:hypothetical protein